MAQSTIYQLNCSVADIRETPDAQAPKGKFETQLVFGEQFNVKDENNGWYRGTTTHDGYAGHIEKKYLSPVTTTHTHIVTAARSLIYPTASIKSPAITTLSFCSHLTITETTDRYSYINNIGWVYSAHLSAIGSPTPDYVMTAQKFLETPYQWGGRSGFGIDCSGLVQVSLGLSGISVPRDTDQQINSIGDPVSDIKNLKRGDIIFFPGHVGIMIDSVNILHANAHHMKTVIERLDIVTRRSQQQSDAGVISIRRLRD